MKKIIFIFTVLFISIASFGQSAGSFNPVFGKQDFKDSLKFSKFLNSVGEDSVLTIDRVTKKLKFVLKGGGSGGGIDSCTSAPTGFYTWKNGNSTLVETPNNVYTFVLNYDSTRQLIYKNGVIDDSLSLGVKSLYPEPGSGITIRGNGDSVFIGGGNSDTALIKSLISDSTKLFGIQDSTGRQYRVINMQNFGLDIRNAGNVNLRTGTSDSYTTIGEINVTPAQTDIINYDESGAFPVMSRLSLNPNGSNFFQFKNGTGADAQYSIPFNTSAQHIPLSVRINGVDSFANSTGRIDLGTISGGGSLQNIWDAHSYAEYEPILDTRSAYGTYNYFTNHNTWAYAPPGGAGGVLDNRAFSSGFSGAYLHTYMDRPNGISWMGIFSGGADEALYKIDTTYKLELISSAKDIRITVDSSNLPQNMLYVDAANRIWKAAVPSGGGTTFNPDTLEAAIATKLNSSDTTLMLSTRVKLPTGETVGSIKTDLFQRTSLGADYTDVTPAAIVTMALNKLTLTGGGNNSFNYVAFNNYTAAEKFTITLRYVNRNISTTSQGPRIGIISTNAYGYGASSNVGVNQNTGNANLGKAFAGSPTSVFSTSGTAIAAISAGDTIELSFTRDRLTTNYYAKNLATGQASYGTTTFSLASLTGVLNNTGTPAIWTYNGASDSCTITYFNYTLNERKNPEIMEASNSIGVGQGASTIANRWANLFYNNTYMAALSNGGADVSQSVVDRLPEIKTINPNYFVLMDGSNDVQYGVAIATTMGNLQKVRDSLRSWNKTVIHAAPIPRNAYAAGMKALRDSIYNRFAPQGDIVVVETFDSLSTSNNLTPIYNSGDNVHPSDAGHARIAFFIKQYLPVKGFSEVAYGAGSSSTPAAGSESEVQYNASGLLSSSSTFKFSPIGTSIGTKSYAGLIASPVVSSISNTDTVVSMFIRPILLNGANTGVIKQTFKIGNQFMGFDSLWNFSIGNGSAGKPTQGNLLAIGNNAGSNASGAYNTVAIGREAGYYSTNGYNSFFGGYNAGGYISGNFSTNANNDVFIGKDAGAGNVSVNNSVALGSGSGAGMGSYSVAIGNGSASGAGSISIYSIAIGNSAMAGATGTPSAVVFGTNAAQNAVNSTGIIAMGNTAAFRAANSQYSFMAGLQTGRGASSEYSFLAGFKVGDSTTHNITGDNNIVIGTNITTPTAATSNSINLGNVLYGANTYATTTGNPSATPQTTGRIGINAVPNASAALDVTSTTGGVLMPRMTATQASAITKVDGLIVYVTNTDATFTALGFWGVENNIWVKL